MRAKLIVNNESEVTIEDGIVAVGRASDNTIPLDYDSNVSRYHIEIETRGDEFWLVELGSSNGTTVCGEKVSDEIRLHDGDVILLGGTSEIIFELEKEPEKETTSVAPPAVSASANPTIPASGGSVPSVSAPTVSAPPAAADANVTSKMPTMLIVMGVVCGLALIAVVVAVGVSYSGGGKCEAKVSVTSPEKGDTIKKETDIEVQLQDEGECVAKASYFMDGDSFADATDKPFRSSVDPSKFTDTPDGSHRLKVVLQDENGEKIAESGEVELVFETLVEATPTPKPTATPAGEKPTPKTDTGGKTPSTTETQEMIRGFLGEFKSQPGYRIDPQFSQEVQKKTAEYAADGYFARAQTYHQTIIAEYYQGVSLDPPLGYILAMSRTQFKPASVGGEEGLWRMNKDFVQANGYTAACGEETLSDPKQTCAAKASALYMKALFFGVFDKDLIYSVAAFGMTTGEATTWKNSLPANRTDFWNVIKNQKQREEIVRFFAAGIVAENPQKFRLKDPPISTLYKNYLVK